jgi:uncharacterized protein with HEPN domain
MRDAAVEAIGFARGRTRYDLESDRMLLLALVKDIEIIGEAATQLTDGTRSAIASLPWQEIVGMRNRLIHAYFDINRDVVWRTVTEDLPKIVSVLDKLVD